jgi:hypothetical protein
VLDGNGDWGNERIWECPALFPPELNGLAANQIRSKSLKLKLAAERQDLELADAPNCRREIVLDFAKEFR